MHTDLSVPLTSVTHSREIQTYLLLSLPYLLQKLLLKVPQRQKLTEKAEVVRYLTAVGRLEPQL